MRPYTNIYAVQLGASPIQMGWLRSLTSLSSTVTQVAWGIVVDSVGKRVFFIVFGGIVASLLWIPMVYVTAPWQLITLLVLQAFIGSMTAPAWASLIADLVPFDVRGSVTATINTAAAIGSTLAALISGAFMSLVGEASGSGYTVPLLAAALLGLTSSIVMLAMKEPRNPKGPSPRAPRLEAFRSNLEFRRFCGLAATHGFFMALPHPLFPITLLRVLRVNAFEAASLYVIDGVTVMLTAKYLAGRIVDRVGRKPLLIVGQTGTFIAPTAYIFATSLEPIYLQVIASAIFLAFSEVASFAYLLDILSRSDVGTFMAVYHMTAGFFSFLGSMTGGYLASAFISLGIPELTSTQLVYLFSAIGRFGSGLLYYAIKEPHKYPSTLKDEFLKGLGFIRRRLLSTSREDLSFSSQDSPP